MSFFERMRHRSCSRSRLLLFTLSIGIVIGTLVNTGVRAAKDAVLRAGCHAADDSARGADGRVEFTELAKKLEASVVNISTVTRPVRCVPAAPDAAGRRQRRNGHVPPLFRRSPR